MRHDNATIHCERGNANVVGLSTHGSDLTNISNSLWQWIKYLCPLQRYYYSSNTGQVGYLKIMVLPKTGGTSANIGLYVQYGIYCVENVYVASDRRIKNIVDVPDNKALENIRNIPCHYYDYKMNEEEIKQLVL